MVERHKILLDSFLKISKPEEMNYDAYGGGGYGDTGGGKWKHVDADM